MLPIVVIQHEESVPPGSITQAFEDTGTEHYVLEAWKRPRWPSVDELGGLVVLGGTMNVDELEAFPMLRNSRRLMTDALERDLPTLGVCLGSQMMARVLGSDVVRAQPRNALFSTLDVIGDEALAEDWGVSRAELEAQADRHLDTQAAAGRELLHRFLEVASTAAR